MKSAGPDAYDGIPYEELAIDTIEWRPTEERHIRHRSTRKGQPNEVDIEGEWATEAALASPRWVGDSESKSGLSIRVVGYSSAAGRVLAVFLIPKDHPPTGAWWGTTARVASRDERQGYERHKEQLETGDQQE